MIENKTEYTLKKYRQFNLISTYKQMLIISVFVTLVSGALIAISFIESDTSWIFLSAGIAFFALMLIYYLVRYLNFGKTIKSDIRREYFFDTDKFSVSSSNKGNLSKTEYSYDKIIYYKKDSKNIYIYITKKSAFIVGNEGYSLGNREGLLKLLEDKIKHD